MMRRSSALPALGRVLLACSLCLLAFAFALEAKTAWYSPTLGPARDVSAAKAMPADTPAVDAQRAHVVHPVRAELPLTWFEILAAALLSAIGATEWRLIAALTERFCIRPYFFSVLFFRPPPAYR